MTIQELYEGEKIMDEYITEDIKTKAHELFEMSFNRGFKAGMQVGFERGLKVSDNYEKGLNEAWEFTEKIAVMNCTDMEKIFNSSDLSDIIQNYTPRKAIEKIKEYEKNKRSCKTCGHVIDNKLTCEVAKSGGNCHGDFSEWIPKQTEQNCNSCKNNNDELGGLGGNCYECVKGIKNHYELKDDDDIKVGDEVTFGFSSKKGIVIEIYEDSRAVVLGIDGVTIDRAKYFFTKTGRNFPQIIEILKQIKEEK